MKKAAKDLLAQLVTTRDLKVAQGLCERLEREHDFRWRAVGDREGNYGNISIGSDPGHAFVERVTNAIDAVIEREALRRQAKGKPRRTPTSPRDAVEEWFEVPGGRLSSLPAQPSKEHKKGTLTRQVLADEVVIGVFESGQRKMPTVEIRDHGVGLTPTLVPQTILSLNETNKINKTYLAGAYGQGGSTALAFSPQGTVIATRRQPDLLAKGEADLVAVTFVRFNELDPDNNKNGRFEYLVQPDRVVPSIEAEACEPSFAAGTSCVHFQLNIPQYSARITQPTRSLWWLLQNTLFDPVLPFWVEERRPSMFEAGKKPLDRRVISGLFTRLTDDKNDRIEHFGSTDVTVVHSGTETTVKVNYWVVKPPDSDSGDAIAAYVDPYRPIAFTFNGQTHGTEERRFSKERLGLPYLANFLVIQVELDHLNAQARRSLLSTTRDRLKRLEFYDEMMEAIAAALSEDENLSRLDDERKERLLSKHSQAERDKMKQRFARLMERFKAGVDATAKGKGTSGAGRKEKESGSRKKLEPLATKPQPTFLRIGNTQKPIPIRMERQALIRLESDAPDSYLFNNRSAKLTLGSDPEGALQIVSKSDFAGGRSRMTVKPTDKCKPGDEGTLTVFLFTPDEKQFSAKVGFKVMKAEDDATSGSDARAKVQVPEPIGVRRDEWADHGWDEKSVAKVADSGKDTQIYVNLDNQHLVRLLEGASYQEVGITRMRNNFLLYAAFYAWAKHGSDKDSPLHGKDFEQYEQQEYDRVAQTVVHAISSLSRTESEEDED